MAIQAIIWDLGGVLVRTEDYAPRTALAARHGMHRTALESLVFDGDSGRRAQLGEISAAEHWQHVAETLAVPPEQIPDLQNAFWGGDRLDEDLVNRIRALRTNRTTALLSNAFSDLRHFVETRWRIADAFDHVVISAEVGRIKPDVGIYQLALQGLAVAPEAAVFIDDLPENVAGAQAAGLHAIRFESASQAWNDLEKLLAD